MEHLLSLFRRHNLPLFLIGSVARHFIRFGTWGRFGIIEFIVVAKRQQIAAIEELGIEKIPHHGPLVARMPVGGIDATIYFYPLSPFHDLDEVLTSFLRRRGISVDAIAIDELGKIIDPFQGVEDIERRKIRLLDTPPLKAFEIDALRLIKLSRMVAEFGTHLDRSLRHVMRSEAGRILYSYRDGWFRELSMILCSPYPTKGLQMLHDTRILGFLLPEVNSMVGFAESSRYHHKDIWEHTCQVIEQSPPNLLVRWAALLHDVGKVWTRTYGEHQEVHFFQHDELGAILVEGIASRFRMEPSFEKALRFLVRYHQRPANYESSWTDSAVRRLITEAGEYLPALLQLSRADMTSKSEKKRKEAKRLADELERRVAEIIAKDSIRSPLPKGIGSAIMESFSLAPGPRIGRIKKFLEQAVQDGLIQPNQSFDYYIDFLAKQSQLPE